MIVDKQEPATDKQLFAAVKQILNMTCRKVDGEYRVNYCHGEEATAYYTCDRADAWHTAVDMHARRLARNTFQTIH